MNPVKSILRRSVREAARQGLLPAPIAARLLFRIALGRFPDLKNPRDFNEKVMWLEFNTDTTRWSELADKIAVRDYVRAKGLGGILLEQYCYADSPEQISLAGLPGRFVMKTNNGNAQTLLVRDKSLVTEAALRRTAARWMRSKRWKASAEPHYGRIRPRILFEQMLPGAESDIPVDYKFFCFDGKALYCEVCTERETKHFNCKMQFYKLPDWKLTEGIVIDSEQSEIFTERPEHLDLMIQYAETLAGDMPFMRVDLFDTPQGVFFGELTFTPSAARIDWLTPGALREFGDMIELKEK